MKSKAKLLLIMILSFVFLEAAGFAMEQNDVPKKYKVQSYTKAVEKKIGHKSEEYEKSIIDTAYSYYGNACNFNWDKESWKEAVEKGAELCRNKIAIAAAKTGEFGEKLLKALVQTTKEAGKSISNWLDKKSQEYDEQQYEKERNNKEKDNKKNKNKKAEPYYL